MKKDFGNCSVAFSIHGTAWWGKNLDNAVNDCLALAKVTNNTVHLDFNGVDLRITKYHTLENVKNIYHTRLDEKIKNA